MTRLDVQLSPHLREVGPEAIAAEASGVAQGWVPETVADPFAASAVALMATSALQVGTGVSVAFARSPFAVAQSSWELARASGGRFTLGLGTQVKVHAERRFSVEWERPIERLRDYIGALRAIWRSFQEGTALRYEGTFYRHTLLTAHFDPGPIDHPDVPVFISGVNVRTVELAGEVADGLIAHPLHTPHYLESVVWPAIRRGAERAGRDPSRFRVIVPVWAISGETEAELAGAATAIKRQIGLYGSTTAYRAVFESEGWTELQPALNRALKESGPSALADLVPDEVLSRIAVSCSPSGLADSLDSRFLGLATAAMLNAPVPSALSTLGGPSLGGRARR
jgi:probable F420-dependent oxidoreductase